MNRGFGSRFQQPRYVQQHPAYDEYAAPDDYADGDEIMTSSPCPPERGTRRFYTQQPVYSDPIDDFVDDEYYEDQPIYAGYSDNQQMHYEPQPPPQVNQYQPQRQYQQAPAYTHQRQPVYYQQQQQQQQEMQPEPLPLIEEEQEEDDAPIPSQQREILTKTKGIQLRPVSELPDMYRSLFKFGVFNAVQSSCFDTLIMSNENLVASAPTGSGKTVLFELAMIQMLTRTNSAAQNSMKCVYMAPTKALCSERYRDWTTKFSPLGIKCCELTGDTVTYGKGVWGDAKNSTIIVTTSEKWDSLTRNWSDHETILSSILLFLVDEVHILNESRGSTLEVVISRMKLRGSSVRFVLVSATAPNIQDIAAWIGSCKKDGQKAKVFEFGEDFRPCKLKRVVVGVPRQRGQNDFQFAKNLDYKLFPTLQTHSVGKPILVFCSTRKGVFSTAEHLVKDYKDAEKKKQALPWTHSERIEHSFNDKRLTELSSYGVGVHHAGMSIDDRRAVEDLFLKRTLRIIIATSTLAVGVNLPAHTVVVKGVHTFQNNASVEYSDLDIMQMLGRAGRPQFDTEGTAIILCEGELETKYRELVQGKTILESSLHLNLSEHLNSEIGLGTVTSIKSATNWLRSSFLFQRVQNNPRHYALGKEEDETWEERVDDLVLQSITKLKESSLIVSEGKGEDAYLKSTEYGDIMSKLYIRQATMALILALPEKPSVREILEMVSSAEELTENKMRASDKTYLNKLRKHNDIRFEVKKVEKTADKVFLLIQAILGGISLSSPEYKTGDSQPHLDAFGIFKHVSRIARAVAEVGITKKRGAQLKHGFEVLRCLTAKAWEDRPVVLRQIDTIGEKSLKVLAEHGITSLEILRKQDSMRLETLLNRRPPFGLEMLAAVREFPLYTLRVTESEVRTSKGHGPVEIDLNVECGIADETGKAPKGKPKKFGRSYNITAVITMTSEMDLIDFRRISTKSLSEKKSFEVTATLEKPSQAINVYICSETYAGLTVTRKYKPDVPSTEYPTRDTRPPNALQSDLEGLEDDPDFWASMEMDDELTEEVDVKPAVKDLTKPQAGKKELATKDLTTKTQPRQPAKPNAAAAPVEPRKLPNGNYECGHLCKDKEKCRHLCCHEGLPKPSKTTTKTIDHAKTGDTGKTAVADKKKTTSTSKPAVSSSSKSASAKTSTTVDLTSPIKPPDFKKRAPKDNTLENLETLHNNTSTLKMPAGHRLKVDSGAGVKRKRKEPHIIDTNVGFTDLKDANDTSPSPPRRFSEADDDDDLPEPHEIMATVRKPVASSDDYFDDDMDELIWNLPSDHDAFSGKLLTSKSSAAQARSSIRRKSSAEPPHKRARFDEDVQVLQISDDSQSQGQPLFTYADSDEYDVMIIEDDPVPFADAGDEDTIIDARPGYGGDYAEIDDFSLDPNCFDIVPSTPDLTRSSYSEDERSLTVLDAPTATAKETRTSGDAFDWQRGVKAPEPIEEPKGAEDPGGEEEELDDFAQLEAWLNSGAVEIVG